MEAGQSHAWDLRWDLAVQQFEQALAVRPGDPEATVALAKALERAGNLAAACDHYRQARALLPESIAVLVNLVDVQQRLGALSDAATTYVDLAALYISLGQPHRATGILHRLHELPRPAQPAIQRLIELCVEHDREDIAASVRALAPVPADHSAGSNTDVQLSASVRQDENAEVLSASSPEAPIAPEEADEDDLHLPSAVRHVLENLDADGRDPAIRSPVVSAENDWCPLVAELRHLPRESRGNLATALYESTRDVCEQRLASALDACWQAIAGAVTYLPAQVQLARVQWAAGFESVAEERLRLVAAAYEQMGMLQQAAEVWAELGSVVSDPEIGDTRFISLLVAEGRQSQAVALLQRSATRAVVAGRINEAVAYLDRALVLSGPDVDTQLWRARLLAASGRADEAESWLAELEGSAVADDPRIRAARALRAAQRGSWKHIDACLGGWNDETSRGLRALTEAAAWGEPRGGTMCLAYLFGRLAAWAGVYRLADEQFQKALALFADGQSETNGAVPPAVVSLALGRVAMIEQEWERASHWVAVAIEQADVDVMDAAWVDEALTVLADVAARHGNSALQAEALRRRVDLHPDDPQLRLVLAECQYRLGKVDEAVTHFSRVAEAFERRGDIVRALAAEQAGAALAPVDPKRQVALARRYCTVGLLDEGIAAFKQALALADGANDAPFAVSVLRDAVDVLETAHPEAALAFRVLLVERCPEDWSAARDLIAAYERLGRADEAVTASCQLGAALRDAGRLDEAVSLLREALGRSPGNQKLAWELEHTFAVSRGDDRVLLVRRLRQREPNPESGQHRGDIQDSRRGGTA